MCALLGFDSIFTLVHTLQYHSLHIISLKCIQCTCADKECSSSQNLYCIKMLFTIIMSCRQTYIMGQPIGIAITIVLLA